MTLDKGQFWGKFYWTISEAVFFPPKASFETAEHQKYESVTPGAEFFLDDVGRICYTVHEKAG